MTPVAFAILAVGAAMMRNGSKASLDAVVYTLAFIACAFVVALSS